MKGKRKICFSYHACMRAKERNLNIEKLTKFFKKSHFARLGYKPDERIFVYERINFVVALLPGKYKIITVYERF